MMQKMMQKRHWIRRIGPLIVLDLSVTLSPGKKFKVSLIDARSG